jgi:glycosyltransferase involved in cell wall biosynthesis
MRILAAVYNPIAFDGRVQRACEALSEIAELTLVCPDGAPTPEGLPFDVHALSSNKTEGMFRRVSPHFIFYKGVLAEAKRLRPHVFHAHDYYMAFLGILVQKVTGAKLVYDAHELIIPEPNNAMGLRHRFWYSMEYLAVKHADLIICANEERAELMAEHYGFKRRPLVVRNIPPEPEGELDLPRELKDRLQKKPGETLLVYQGDISFKRGLGRILEVIPILPDNFRLVIIGGGIDAERVLTEAERLGIKERITYLGRVPRFFLHSLLVCCDVGLICYPYEGLNNIYCAPNKIFEYAHAGLPIVATDQPSLKRLIETYSLGACIGAIDPHEKVANVIFNVANRPFEMNATALSSFLSEYRWQQDAKVLRLAVQDINNY